MRRGAKTVLVLLAGVAAALFLTSTSFAMGPYMGVHVGGIWQESAEIDYIDPTLFDDRLKFDMGFNVGGSLGYNFGMARLEAEVAYRQSEADSIRSDGNRFAAEGDFSALSFLVNGYLDMETGGPVTPYLGAGLGFANVSANEVKVIGPPFGTADFVDDDDTVFAYQVGAGVAFALNEAMALDLAYRYFAASAPEFIDQQGFGGFETDFRTHNLSLGLRINF